MRWPWVPAALFLFVEFPRGERAGDASELSFVDRTTPVRFFTNLRVIVHTSVLRYKGREFTASDIFGIQTDLARQIVHMLRARLSPEEDVSLARTLLRRTIQLDLEFAQAYAGLGCGFSAMEGYHQAGAHWLDSAFVAAERAIELDARHPAYPTQLARVFGSLGNTDRALELLQGAQALQPGFPWAHQERLWILMGAGRLEEADAHRRSIAGVLALAREYLQSSFLLALHRGEYLEAVAWYDRDPFRVLGGIVSGATRTSSLRGHRPSAPSGRWCPGRTFTAGRRRR